MNDMQTTLCYIEREGRTLMLHRVKKKNDMNHDKWLGVGGKFEPGESPEECMLREVRRGNGADADTLGVSGHCDVCLRRLLRIYAPVYR